LLYGAARRCRWYANVVLEAASKIENKQSSWKSRDVDVSAATIGGPFVRAFPTAGRRETRGKAPIAKS
jgi:hypothetical protein